MKHRTLLLLSCLLIALPTFADAPSSFSAAKRIAWEIYADHRETFYCGCNYSGPNNTPDLEGCGYQVRKQPKRAARIEWEHVMPAYDFGRAMQCWQEGGRKNCEATSPEFNRAEGDLINLVPSIGEVNGDRSNLRYGMATSVDAFQYGACQSKVDFGVDRFEPRPEVRGDIARTYWYMRDTYGIDISSQQQRQFEAWATADPVDSWEFLRNQRIAAIQGSGNPYIEPNAEPAPLPTPAANDPIFAQPSAQFDCGTKKTCGVMASCEEAIFHLQQCGNGRLDGDNDGTPCGAICR
ncbi:endonuclease [Halomonas sp. McH1-25]|uniref:endonuclease n=1 Tax=unclassified Halomonas TaxID=2609666 RepID=UPI001EF3DEE9|nr:MULTISPECIES: endonuclease [unclassified Halomonas]MCG7598420.1 endonuclease [Halomonas sp. McH1-25]MCP1343756.1 endonuclease [Halomonas sp. FL8]MCP1361735.1 endonuclease [Halomonas sp. BBD45]MCP1363997.1 endonuclease [Halomonas sp. BBD48]